MANRQITRERVAAFETHLIEAEKSVATCSKYRRDLRRFAAYAGGRPLTKAVLLAYKAQLAERYAIRSANSMLAALNAFLRFCGWHDLCVKQYRVQQDAYCSERRELTKAEYTALVRAAERAHNDRLALVLQTICGTGIRISELRCITVEAARRGEAAVTCKGKTRKVFIIPQLRSKLLHYARTRGVRGGSIFLTAGGRPLDRSNVWREMKALCRQAGVCAEKVFPHNLRHLFARTFYGLEKDLAKLADILGHSSINTTRIYVMTTSTEHKRRMESMRLVI